MNPLNLKDVVNYVEEHINDFHEKRIRKIVTLKLKDVLRKKNPYLFKAKHLLSADSIIRSFSDAFISSGEETIFGDWLEGLAIFVNQEVYGGRKSGIPNIDLEFDKEGTRYLVSIKSGPNWGNSSQVKKMEEDFKKAAKTLRTSNSGLRIVAVNGCCYGIENNPDKGDYFKYCGQRFWEFISGNANLYLDIIEPLGIKAKERNEEFLISYGNMVTRFTRDFIADFCFENGSINWEKLVQYNSGA